MILLGIDCGTQSTKTVAFDAESGAILAQAGLAYDLIPGLPSGHMEQDPKVWVDAMEQTIGGVIQALGALKTEIVGIGISGQQHGFVPLDENGSVIRPAKLWCDTSTVEECEILSKEFGGSEGLSRLIGNDMLPGYTAPKILWMKRHEPENFKKLACVLLPHDYLNFYLTGVRRMEFGDASGTALLDVRTRAWATDLCHFIDPNLLAKLPPLSSSQKSHGTLRHELAEKWGIPQLVTVSAGGGDNMMGAIGTGNVRDGRVTASLGTSGTIYAYSSKPVVHPQGSVAAFCDSTDGWLPLVCTMNVTVATEATRKLFGWTLETMNTEIAKIAPGSGGLLFLPYLQGERTPNLPNGSGVFHGINLNNYTPATMARATMEGVTLGLAYGLGELQALGVQPREIRLTGGGSKSAVWRQMCADVFGCRVVTMKCGEGAAVGGAIQALAAVRPEKSIAEWADQLVQVENSDAAEPNPATAKIYRELLKRHTGLMKALHEQKYL